MGDFYVRNPLRAAAAWVRHDASRKFTYLWKNAKFTGYEGVVGVDGELDGGVKFQLRYDWDTNHGFHVNAKKKESRGTTYWKIRTSITLPTRERPGITEHATF